MKVLTINEMSKGDLLVAISVLEHTLTLTTLTSEKQAELIKAIDEMTQRYKELDKGEKIREFFRLNKEFVNYFGKVKKYWEIVDDFEMVSHYSRVYELIELYDNIGEHCSECDMAKEFIFKCDTIGLSDNTMGNCLKVSYFNCVGAIVEWLQHIGEICFF